jgi:arylsulfatase B
VGYPGSEIRTPHLDKLAAAGVRLEHHYVYPTCSPTRAGLLTGRNPSRFGIAGPIAGRSEQTLPAGTPTLASVLKARGYATALFGKWHLALRPEAGPRQYGFDQTYGYLHGQIDQYTHRYWGAHLALLRAHYQRANGRETRQSCRAIVENQ